MELLNAGLVESFDLYELSEYRIAEVERISSEMGLRKRVRVIHGNAFKEVTEEGCYDFVHWNNSLHHMLDVVEAVRWSHKVLRPSGMFFMDDYVGASRFQWSDQLLKIASDVRKALPEEYLKDPEAKSGFAPREVGRPNEEILKAKDPSEAADSERIIDAVKNSFPDAEIMMTGGVVYFLAISWIIQNFDEKRDKELLDMLMLIDNLCAEGGNSLYATALAIKNRKLSITTDSPSLLKKEKDIANSMREGYTLAVSRAIDLLAYYSQLSVDFNETKTRLEVEKSKCFALINSTSWRITAIFRMVNDSLRHRISKAETNGE